MNLNQKASFKNRVRGIACILVGLLTSGLPVASARAQGCTPQPSGLVGWWQGEGAASDLAGSNSGLLEGGITFVPGKVGQAFSFNGTSADVKIAASPTLNVGAGDGFTIDFWVKPANLSEHPMIEWNAGDFQTHFWMSSPPSSGGGGAGCLYADLKEGTTDHTIASAGGLLTTTSFQHVALTYDKNSGFATLYLNGAVVAQQNLGTFTPRTTGDLYLGLRPAGPGAGMRFFGQMDEIDLFNRALDGSEIGAIYTAGVAGKCGVAPIISTPPHDLTVGVGENATLTVGIQGSRPVAYQWRLEGVDMAGATNSSLVLTNLQLTNTGNYSVYVTNAYGEATSTGAALTVVATTCTPLPDGLVSWWQAQGDATDIIGANHGTLQGGVTFTQGKVGQAYLFNGTSGYISIPASTSLNVGTGGGFTIEGWINPTDLFAEHPLVEWNNGSQGLGAHFWINQADPLGGGAGSLFANIIDDGGNSHYLASAGGLLIANGFQHVALSYDNSSGIATIYYNGTAVSSQFLGVFTPQTSYNLYLGKRPSGPSAGALYPGIMDEMSLYNRALLDSEVQSIYESRNTGKCLPPPNIVTQPVSQTVGVGTTSDFTVVASGVKPLAYQWQRSGTNLVGATSSSFAFSNVQVASAGVYSVIVSNSGGSVNSSNAVLTVFVPTCTSTPANLAASWQGEGDSSDSAGFNNGVTQGNLSFANGKVGKAMSFNGTDAFVSAPASATLNVGTNSGFTIEGWIKPADLSSQLPLVEWNTGTGAYGVHFWVSTPAPFGSGVGCLYANIHDISNTSHYLASAGGLVVTNSFQHVALTYDKASGVATLCLNGATVATQTLGTFTPQTSYNLFLGRRPSGPALTYFKGLMDEMSLYSRVLSTNEIQAIYLADTAGRCAVAPSLVFQPQSQLVKPGTNVTFAAGVKGSRPMTFAWQLNGVNLPGATNVSLTLTNVQTGNAGVYSLKATNSLSSVVSANATLKVNLVSVFGNGTLLTNSQYGFGGSVGIQMQNFYANGYIFYTLDGTTPNFGSAQYSGPFTISQNSIIRAIGYSSDFFQSAQTDPIAITILPTYTLTAATPGGGTIALNPSTGPYTSNTVVTMTATPTAGWTFLQWLGDVSGTNTTNSVTLTRNKKVQALFGTTLSTTAAGGGSVQVNPAATSYPYGTVVTISAIPQAGNFFALWGNAASGNINPLSFTVTNANQTVSSLFSSLSAGQVALAAVPVGRGKVTINPRANTYSTGQGVTLSATPDVGQSFIGWSGDASGTVNPLTVTLNQSKVIYANFSTTAKLTFDSSLSIPQEGFRLTLSGEFGAGYRLEGSTNLVNWTTLLTFTNSFGTLQYLDSGAGGFGRRFYRSVLLP